MPSMPLPRSTKQPKLVRLVTGAFHHGARRILALRFFPGIAKRLFQTQRNPALSGVHSQHDRFHHFAGLQHVARSS